MVAAMKYSGELFRELWRHLPAWFIFYITAWSVFADIAFLKEPRYDYAAALVFPYTVFLLYYRARLRSLREGDPVKRFLVLLGVTGAMLALIIGLAGPVRLGPDWPSHADAFMLRYEISNIVWALLLAGHCLTFGGWRRLAVFFGVAALYGMILESGGVAMGYFSEDHYHLYLPGFSAPAATMFGWSTVFYPCVFILEELRRGFPRVGARSFALQGLLVAVIALCFDAVVDPFATAFGLWRWHPAYTPETSFFFLGVPLVNFVSWFSAVFSFGAVYFFMEMKKAAWSGTRRAAAMLTSLPLVLALAALIEFASLAAIEGTNGPSWTILKNYIKAGMPMTREPVRGKMPGDGEGR